MSETELIDAVNENAARNPEFYKKLQNAVATRDLTRIRILIESIAQERSERISSFSLDRVVDWFAD